MDEAVGGNLVRVGDAVEGGVGLRVAVKGERARGGRRARVGDGTAGGELEMRVGEATGDK